jgi:hypothetical protein
MALEKVRFTLLFRGDSYNVVLPSLMRVSEAMEYVITRIIVFGSRLTLNFLDTSNIKLESQYLPKS